MKHFNLYISLFIKRVILFKTRDKIDKYLGVASWIAILTMVIYFLLIIKLIFYEN